MKFISSTSDWNFVLYERPRWWLGSERVIVFVLFVAALLPCICSDDSSSSNRSIMYADINISYVDLNNKHVVTTYKGSYGQKSLVSNISGVVVLAKTEAFSSGKKVYNNYGCKRYSNVTFPSESWIALVERGECQFSDKIRVAIKEHNASAVAIFNHISGEKIFMDHFRDPTIIAVLLNKEHGKAIADLLNKNIRVHMYIAPGDSPDDEHSGISKTSVLFVSVSFIVLVIVSLAWLIFYYIQKFRFTHAKERLARRLARAAKKAIVKIPQRTLKAGDKELDSEHDQCAVCIESYKYHDVIRILPCQHVFHKSCVDPWLLDQRTCPMCKMDILRAYGMQVVGSQESVHPEAEVGHVTVVPQEEPEMSSSAEENHLDSFKVPLMPQSCLHFCSTAHKTSNDDKTPDTLHGAFGGAFHISVSTNSLCSESTSSSSSNSRAYRSDKTESVNSERQALIGRGKEYKVRWRSDEVCADEDEENPEAVALNIESAKEDSDKRQQRKIKLTIKCQNDDADIKINQNKEGDDNGEV